MKSKKIELLAPVGSLDNLKWAILYGANAVYLGGKDYSLRANAKNFTLDEIKEAVSYAHSNDVKVYVTVNIVFHNEDTKGLTNYLKELSKIGVDAIIFSDPLIIDIINDKLHSKWLMSLEKINVCRDCKFRYACKDCRPLAESSNSINDKNPRCLYNPYKGEWVNGAL